MNSKVMALMVAGLMGLAASADVLYWQVNDSAASAAGISDYSQAYLKATDGANEYYVSQNYASDGTTPLGAGVAKSNFSDGYAIGDLASILSAADGTTPYGGQVSDLSFYLEMYDAAGDWQGKTAAVSYGDLGNAVSSGFNPEFSGVNNAMGGSSSAGYSNVPEPTSGLLMLVGFGALALRRRKAA